MCDDDGRIGGGGLRVMTEKQNIVGKKWVAWGRQLELREPGVVMHCCGSADADG